MLRMTHSTAKRLTWLMSTAAGCILICGSFTGCQSMLNPIDSIPANRVPAEFLVQPQATKKPVDLARLRQTPPENYLLDKDDLLGIYIEGVLGEVDGVPPTHFPEAGSDLPPAVGFPIPVREDGTLNLPLVPPIPVRGLTLAQAEKIILDAYTVDNQLLAPDEARIIVTLMKERTYRVIVVRGDSPQIGDNNNQQQLNAGMGTRSDQAGRGFVLDLPAYKNDILQALAETGGLPGVNAKNEVRVLRGDAMDFRRRDKFVREFYKKYYETGDPCYCPPPIPDDPAELRIPLRVYPGVIPRINPKDIILDDGDIVLVESREAEVFYTGGLLEGGEHQLPRDFDLDVLGAVARAGGAVGASSQSLVPGVSSGVGGAPPTELIVLRKTPCNGQIAILVDLNDAVNSPRSRILVAAGDTLILRYSPEEEAINFGLGVFFTYGISQLFSGR